jgi:hypothetical protein
MEQRFLSKVNKTDTCWLWTAYKNKKRYGYYKYDGKTYTAHRVAYELWNGKIPNGLCIRHKCDEPSCVNPAHLETGTIKDNNDDCIERGRRRYNRGEQHHKSKLTDDEVMWIRVLRGFYKNVELAEMYGLDETTISTICLRKRWKHII